MGLASTRFICVCAIPTTPVTPSKKPISTAYGRGLDRTWMGTSNRPLHATPLEKFWELRLAVTFLDLGYLLDAAAEGRPDLATWLPTGEQLGLRRSLQLGRNQQSQSASGSGFRTVASGQFLLSRS